MAATRKLYLSDNENFLNQHANILQEHQLGSGGVCDSLRVYSCLSLLGNATTPSRNLLRMADGPGYPSSGPHAKFPQMMLTVH